MIFLLTLLVEPYVVKKVLAQTVDCNAFHETGWNDTVRINVVAGYVTLFLQQSNFFLVPL